MYNEKTYKSQIFWLKIKRIVIISLYTIIGVSLGVFASFYLIDITMLGNNLRAPAVALPTIFLFLVSLLFTSNIGKDIQEAYWNIELIHKLNNISDKLDNMETLNKQDIQVLKTIKNTVVKKKVKKIPTEIAASQNNLDEIKMQEPKINTSSISRDIPEKNEKEIINVEKKVEPKKVIKQNTTSTTKNISTNKPKIENKSIKKEKDTEDDLLDHLYVKNPNSENILKETTSPFRNVDFSNTTSNTKVTKTKKVVKKKKIPLIPAMANLETDDVYEFEEDDE